MAGFDIVQWCDFVRGVADPTVEDEMQERAETGSRSERRDAGLFLRLARYGRETVEQGPPREAVRIAHAIGSLRPPHFRRPETEEEEEPPLWRRLSFEIFFDSRSQLAAAGTRGHGSSGRHLVLEAGEFTVDVRLEREPPPELTVRPGGFGGSVVTGQILSHNGDAAPVPRTPVFIFAGDRIVRKIFASPSGEFHAEGLPDDPLRLCLLVGNAKVIDIPLELE